MRVMALFALQCSLSASARQLGGVGSLRGHAVQEQDERSATAAAWMPCNAVRCVVKLSAEQDAARRPLFQGHTL